MAKIGIPQQDTLFLPSVCGPRGVMLAVLVGEALALMLVLHALGKQNFGEMVNHLLQQSAFIQVVILSSLLLLCLGRPWLSRLSNRWAAVLSYILIVFISIVVTEIAWWFNLSSILSIPGIERPNADEAFMAVNLGIAIDLHQGSMRMFPEQHQVMLFRNVGITAIVAAVGLRYFYVQHQWRIKTEAEAEARVQALQSRMNPHFLFNSMNTIASLTRIDPALAEQAVEDLAELFRASLANARHLVPLSKEIDLCEQYLRIEGLRLGGRLQTEWMLDTIPHDALVPTLCLQPLLENAIRYGIQPRPDGGVIKISGLTDGRDIKIEIESPFNEQATSRHGNRISTDNLRQRLQVYYGRKGRMDMQRDVDCFRVSLRFPYETKIQ